MCEVLVACPVTVIQYTTTGVYMIIKLPVTHGVVIDLMRSDETLPELKLSHKPIYISLHTKTFARRRDHHSNSFLDCLFASILMDFLVDKIMFHNHSLLHLWCYTTTVSQSKYSATIPLVVGQLECQSHQERTMSEAIFASTEHTILWSCLQNWPHLGIANGG